MHQGPEQILWLEQLELTGSMVPWKTELKEQIQADDMPQRSWTGWEEETGETEGFSERVG